MDRCDSRGRRVAMAVMAFLLACSPFSASLGNSPSSSWQLEIPDMPSSPGQRIQISGLMKNDQFVPSGVELNITADSGTSLPALPLGLPLLENLSVRAFGVEERVEVVRDNDDAIRIHCRAGGKTAGVLLTPVSARFPLGASGKLRVQVQGSSGFEWGVAPAGKDAHLLVPVIPSATGGLAAEIPLNQVTAQIMADNQPLSMALICPFTAADLKIDAIALEPAQAAPAGLRAAWVWNAKRWNDNPQKLLNEAAALGLQRLYIALDVPHGEDGVANVDRLSRFIALATARKISVWAVEGDPNMVLPVGREHALRRLQAIQRYQSSVPQASRLGGLQYDIEPYLLSAYASSPQEVGRQWAQTLHELKAQSQLKLDMVLPFWLPQSPMASLVLEALHKTADSITIMAYRTTDSAIQQAAEPLLAWGTAQGMPVYVALEAGPLPDDVIQTYNAAKAGQPASLWLLPDGKGGRALYFEKPVLLQKGTGYLTAGQITVPASRVSFLGDETALLKAGRNVLPALRAWSAYAGMVFHGLLD